MIPLTSWKWGLQNLTIKQWTICSWPTPHNHSNNLSTHPKTSTRSALMIWEEDICQVFLKQKSMKAPGPDGDSAYCLKTCAHQLAPVLHTDFHQITEALRNILLLQDSTIIFTPFKLKLEHRAEWLQTDLLKVCDYHILWDIGADECEGQHWPPARPPSTCLLD